MNVPFDLETLGPCGVAGSPSLSIDDVRVSEADGQAEFTVSLSPASTEVVSVDVVTLDGSAQAPEDYIALASTNLTFSAGQTSQVVSVGIVNDALTEGEESFSVELSGAVNAIISDGTGIGTIMDDEVASTVSCGVPTFNRNVDQAVFIWQDCNTREWTARMTGGPSSATFVGTVVSSQGFTNVTPFSVENRDTLDFTSNPNEIVYDLTVINGGGVQDGFVFTFPQGASVCFGVDSPLGATVLLGEDRTPVNVPFDLETLGACGTANNDGPLLDDLSVSNSIIPNFDPNIFDYAGNVEFLTNTLTLTAVANGTITVNGSPIVSGQSTSVDLNQGQNTILVVVSESGASTAYTLSVNRESAEIFAQQAYLKASNADADDRFGRSIAIDFVNGTETLAVGAFREDGGLPDGGIDSSDRTNNDAQDSGAVYVFERDSSGVWREVQYLKAPDPDAGDNFGQSVGIAAAGIIFVGAPGDDGVNNTETDIGAVYVFQRQFPGVWTHIQTLRENTENFGRFGTSIAVAQDEVDIAVSAIGTSGTDFFGDFVPNVGKVYVFRPDDIFAPRVWSLQDTLENTHEVDPAFLADDRFGTSISFATGVIVVGVPGYDFVNDAQGTITPDSGAAHIFTRGAGGIWSLDTILGSNSADIGDRFGQSVSRIDSDLVIGAIGDDGAGNTTADSGAAYYFRDVSSGTQSQWQLVQTIRSSNLDAGDRFGSTVNVINNKLIISAFREDSALNAQGLPSPGNNDVQDSGAVYLFQKNANSLFAEQTIFKASNAGVDDRFGGTVAVDATLGRTLIVGAVRESGNSIGGQQDNSLSQSGAVYAFSLNQRVDNASPVAFLNSTIEGELGQAITGTLRGTDIDGDSLTFDATSPFDINLTFDPNTGEFSATPGASNPAVAVLQYTVSDGQATSELGFVNLVFSSAPQLNNLTTSIPLDQLFDPNVFEYSSSVGFLQNTIDVVLTADSAITVNGVSSISGEPVQLVLEEGANTITITLDRSGLLTTYTLTIIRASASTFAQQAYLKASNADADDRFGRSIAIDFVNGTETLAVGAFREDGGLPDGGIDSSDRTNNDAQDSGAVYVFERDSSGVWREVQYLKAPDPDAGDNFGQSVGIAAAGIIFVGAPGDDGVNNTETDIGAVYVFQRQFPGVWTHIQTLRENTENFGRFGTSIAVAQDEVDIAVSAIGTSGTDFFGDFVPNVGKVYVFRPDDIFAPRVWSLQDTLENTHEVDPAFLADDRFGTSISFATGVIVVGVPGYDFVNDAQGTITPDSGAAHIFTRGAGGIWSLDTILGSNSADIGDRFGQSVSRIDSDLVIGAIGDDGAGNTTADSGAAYYFRDVSSGTQSQWQLVQTIRSSNLDAGDRFGSTVNVINNKLIISAFREDSALNAQGLPSPGNNDVQDSGAVYLFQKNANSLFAEQTIFKASNAGVDDRFGGTVAVDATLGRTLIVGAVRESGNSIGGQQDNSLLTSGAVYAFSLDQRIGNADPVSFFTSAIEGLPGQAISGSLRGADIDGDSLTFSASSSSFDIDLTFDPNTGEFTASQGISNPTFAVIEYTVNDGLATSDSGFVTLLFNEVAQLSDLTSSIDLNQPFDPNVFEYSASAVFSQTSIRLTPIVNSQLFGGQIRVNGAEIPSGQFIDIDLAVGSNTITVELVGITALSEYTLTVTRSAGQPNNDLPVVGDVTLTTQEDVAASGILLGSDVNGDLLTYRVLVGAGNGGVVIDDVNTGAFTYTPNGGFTGSDSFTYVANDGSGDSNIGTVSVTVDATGPAGNTPPVANDELLAVAINDSNLITSVLGTLRASDVDGDTLTYQLVENGSLGTAVITDATTGAFTYTPNTFSSGVDTFKYVVSDGQSNSNEATVTIEIGGVQSPQLTNIELLGFEIFFSPDISLYSESFSLFEATIQLRATGQGSITINGVPTLSDQIVTIDTSSILNDEILITLSDENGLTSTYVIRITASSLDQSAFVKASEVSASGARQDARTGLSVAVSGDYMASVGDGNTAIFKRRFVRFVGEVWEQEQNIDNSGPLALQDDVLVIGNDIYVRDTNEIWSLVQGLSFPSNDVAISSDTIAIVNSNELGIFVRDPNSNTWVEQQTLDVGGENVAIDGDTIVTSTASLLGGSVSVFVRDTNDVWALQANLTASNASVNQIAEFGTSVAISGDTIVVGDRLETSPSTGINGSQAGGSFSSGAVYVYVRNTDGEWRQTDFIKGSNTTRLDDFGSSIELNGNFLVVSAPREDSNARGIDGDESNNIAEDSGAVYVFRRDGNAWRQLAYVKASNTRDGSNSSVGQEERFGDAIAFDGNRLVVAAPGEDSSSLFGQNQIFLASAIDSGALYIFSELQLNRDPVAFDLDFRAQAGSTIFNGELFATDNDGDAVEFAVSFGAGTVGGDVIISSISNSFEFFPDPNFSGVASFRYRARDEDFNISEEAEVRIEFP